MAIRGIVNRAAPIGAARTQGAWRNTGTVTRKAAVSGSMVAAGTEPNRRTGAAAEGDGGVGGTPINVL